jgi:acid phosphatase
MRLRLTLLAGLLACGCVTAGTPAPAAPAASTEPCPSLRDTHEQLQGTLWMQTAAEYRILAETIYRTAGESLRAALADPAWSAATEQTSDPSSLPPAVILDLDETVLDNSRFQGEQVVRREPYTGPLWEAWIDRREAGLVFGAKDFLADARAKGVAVFFVTNRTLKQEPATLETLLKLGLQATAGEILSKEENGWTSDKTGRRKYLAERYRILLLVGDDLNDFIAAQLPSEERVAAAEKHSAWWGRRWFLLPNPLYGSWERAVYDNQPGLSDQQILERKLKRVRSFESPPD